GVNGNCLSERRTDDERRPDRTLSFRVATQRLHGAAYGESDTQARAKPAQADSKTGRKPLYGISFGNSVEHAGFSSLPRVPSMRIRQGSSPPVPLQTSPWRLLPKLKPASARERYRRVYPPSPAPGRS